MAGVDTRQALNDVLLSSVASVQREVALRGETLLELRENTAIELDAHLTRLADACAPGADTTVLRKCEDDLGACADVLVRRCPNDASTPIEIRVCVIGNVDAGKVGRLFNLTVVHRRIDGLTRSNLEHPRGRPESRLFRRRPRRREKQSLCSQT